MRRITGLVVPAALSATALAWASPPPIWSDLSFQDANERAQSEERVLVVYGTATWCGPCQRMERTTWSSGVVASWFAEHGLAIKLDVDQQPELARELDIRAMPTLVAFREGEPFDRTVGYHSEGALITWLEDVREGRRKIDRLLEAAGDRVGPDGRVDIRARLTLARELADGGAAQTAAEEYLWLWDNMLDHDPNYTGVRVSFMIGDMQRLAARHASAREAFRERWSQYLPRIDDGSADREEVRDWIVLAKVIDEEDALLDWFDAAKNDPRHKTALMRNGRQFRDLLIERDRWADIVVFYDDPVDEARQRLESGADAHGEADEQFDQFTSERMRRMRVHMDRQEFAEMYAVLLAADREEEADAIATMLVEWDDTTATRGALVTTALKAGQPRLRQLTWIEEAEQMGARVPRARRELTEALGLPSD